MDNEKIEKEINRLSAAVLNLQNDLADVKQWRDPVGREARLDAMSEQMYQIMPLIQVMQSSIKNIMYGRRDEYSDEQIKAAWASSGVTCKEIADKFSISIPMASRYANGDIKDQEKRAELMAFFKLKEMGMKA